MRDLSSSYGVGAAETAAADAARHSLLMEGGGGRRHKSIELVGHISYELLKVIFGVTIFLIVMCPHFTCKILFFFDTKNGILFGPTATIVYSK